MELSGIAGQSFLSLLRPFIIVSRIHRCTYLYSAIFRFLNGERGVRRHKRNLLTLLITQKEIGRILSEMQNKLRAPHGRTASTVMGLVEESIAQRLGKLAA